MQNPRSLSSLFRVEILPYLQGSLQWKEMEKNRYKYKQEIGSCADWVEGEYELERNFALASNRHELHYKDFQDNYQNLQAVDRIFFAL